MLKPTVLIVDDEKPTREGLRAALEDRYDVYLAEDGEGAVRLLEGDAFDVLLTDLRMPGVSGLDLIKRAKSLSKPPICILMTAYGSEEMAVDAWPIRVAALRRKKSTVFFSPISPPKKKAPASAS